MQILILSEFLRLKFVLFVRISPDLLVLLLPSGNICNILFQKWQLTFLIERRGLGSVFIVNVQRLKEFFVIESKQVSLKR